MRYLSLFSGIEAATVAWDQLGWEPVAFAQYDPEHNYKSGPDFPSSVLAHHYPHIPNLGDVTRITDAQIKALGRIDLCVFGSPCQDVSVAGKRKGLRHEDGSQTRSGLFFDAIRLIRLARDHCGLRFALLENVPGLFSSNSGRDFATVLGEMVGADFDLPKGKWQSAGIAVGPDGAVEWSILDAQWFGVAQRRRRVFALADFGDWASRPPILLEPESMLGNPPSRRATGQDFAHSVAPSLTGSGRGVERTGESRGQDPVVAVAATLEATAGRSRGAGTPVSLLTPVDVPDVAWCLQERDHKGADSDTKQGHLIPVQCVTGEITHALKADGFDGSEDGTGRGQPIVPMDIRNGTAEGDVSMSLQGGGMGSERGLCINAIPHVLQPVAAHELASIICDCGHEFLGELNAPCPGCGGIRSVSVTYVQEVADPITAHEHKTWTHEGKNNFRTRNVSAVPILEAGARTGVSTTDPRAGMGFGEDGDPMYTLQTGKQHAVVAFDTTQITHPENRSNPQPGDPCHTLPRDGHAPAIAFQPRIARNGRGAPDEVAAPLTAEAGTTGKGDSAQCVAAASAVRRLTPEECEKLQGFTVYYTRIPWRGRPAEQCPDGPRYKSLGNSFAVPCVLWIGKRIDASVEASRAY